MSKIFYLILGFMSPFILTGCLLIDPSALEKKTGKSENEGKVESITRDKSSNNSYVRLALESKNESLFFEEKNKFDERIIAQIDIGDYIKFFKDHDKKMQIIEITKANENNCKIKIITQYNNNKQMINDFAYVINNEKDEEKCSKYSLKEPFNSIKLLRKTIYIK
jgi:hypothetical protein